MEKSGTQPGNKELSDNFLPENPRYMTYGMQFLVVVAVGGIFNATWIGVLLTGGIAIFLWRVARKQGVSIGSLVFPLAMRQRFVASSFSRKYYRGPIKSNPTLWSITTFINFFILFWAVIMIPSWFTPVLDIDEMRTDTGVVERHWHGGRKSVNRFRLKTTEGESIDFLFYGPESSFEYLTTLTQNDEIKVWSQCGMRGLFNFYNRDRAFNGVNLWTLGFFSRVDCCRYR